MVSQLKLERVKRGLSQIDLGRLCGIPFWRVSLIERGIEPKPDERRKLAKTLRISEDSLTRQVEAVQ